MNLTPEHRSALLDCIRKVVPHAQVFAYGSRARDKAKRSSDLDILIQNNSPLSPLELSSIKEALSLSDLPFFVDIQDYAEVNADFLNTIKADLRDLEPKVN